MYYYDNPNYFKELEKRLQQLEEENKVLQEQVEQIKPLHIENINYKIQELVVKELKGTLNIGMTALSDPKEIQKWLQEAEGEEIQLSDIDDATDDGEQDDGMSHNHQD
ncbi:spore germination protein GerPC [Caldalkalibacillus salinus]|uniref:spore germination protein GerPC n=1 Tax=Caldalkalibacillus salinus TaxID=2803787 RepID=UPI001921E99B|nr:spore germination protein GerPC [Caldalkalibacillus salinus]